MTVFTKLTTLLLIVSLIFITGCKTFKLDSNYTTDPMAIDGNYSDWDNIPALYFEDQKVLPALSNDTNNLYLAFRFRDPKWLMAIHKTGLTIWLDETAGKKENFGIKYSGGPRPQNNLGFERMKKNMPANQKQFENQYVDSTKLFAVLNSEWWYKEQNISTDGTFGPSVKYGFENDMYTYEFAVPLDSIGENYYGINASLGSTISIGLEFGDMDMQRPGGMSGGRGGGKGAGGGGGMSPGGGGGRGGGMRPGGMGGQKGGSGAPSEQKIWIKTKLALAE